MQSQVLAKYVCIRNPDELVPALQRDRFLKPPQEADREVGSFKGPVTWKAIASLDKKISEIFRATKLINLGRV